MGNFFDDIFKLEKFSLGSRLKKLEDNPERVLLGAMTPADSYMWGKITGQDYKPVVDLYGGVTKGDYNDARKAGINTDAGAGMHTLARMIASYNAGSYGAGALKGLLGAASGAGSAAANAAGAVSDSASLLGNSEQALAAQQLAQQAADAQQAIPAMSDYASAMPEMQPPMQPPPMSDYATPDPSSMETPFHDGDMLGGSQPVDVQIQHNNLWDALKYARSPGEALGNVAQQGKGLLTNFQNNPIGGLAKAGKMYSQASTAASLLNPTPPRSMPQPMMQPRPQTYQPYIPPNYGSTGMDQPPQGVPPQLWATLSPDQKQALLARLGAPS